MRSLQCFNSPNLSDLWEKANISTSKKDRCTNPCRDCLPQFQLRMRKLNRCDHPETMFTIEQKAVIGYWPVIEKQEFA